MEQPRRRRTDKAVTVPIVAAEALTETSKPLEIARRAYEKYRVARRAYELFEARGRLHGHDVDDWLQAERELPPLERGHHAARAAGQSSSRRVPGDARHEADDPAGAAALRTGATALSSQP